MAKFRKKPIVIEAEQWQPGKNIDGVVSNWDNNPMMSGRYSVQTLEGWLTVSPGDWIITVVAGERYPCKDWIFRATYESVEDAQTSLQPGESDIFEATDDAAEQA